MLFCNWCILQKRHFLSVSSHRPISHDLCSYFRHNLSQRLNTKQLLSDSTSFTMNQHFPALHVFAETYMMGDYHEHYVQTGHQYVLSYMGAGVAQSIQRLTTDWKTDRPGFDLWQSQRIFLLASVSRAALGPIQALIQWVSWVLQRAKSGRGVTLTTHFRLVMRLSTSRSYISYSPCRLLGSIGTALHEAWNILWII
jgi:hypothetical protein